MLGYLVQYGAGTLRTGIDGQLYLHKDRALVLFRQERRGQAREQDGQAADDQQEDQHIAPTAAQYAGNAALVARRAAIEHAVEPAEEALLLLMIHVRRPKDRKSTRLNSSH